jgi:hypothetical protein
MMIGLFLIPPRRKIFHQSHPRRNREGGEAEEERKRNREMSQIRKTRKKRMKKRRIVKKKLRIVG